MASIRLRNPHSVMAILESRPQDVYEIQCPEHDLSSGWQTVRQTAEELGIQVTVSNLGRQGGKSQNKQRRHAGAEAVIKERKPESLDALITSPDPKGIWVGLDTVQDPHNVGSIFRSSAFFGVSGLITTHDRNAPISYTVYDVASGGVEYVPFAIETNLSRSIDRIKNAGIWILGTSEHANKDIYEIERDRPWLVILGNEEDGLRHLTANKCDELVSVPRVGNVGSLNVAVAAGIVIGHLASK
ncbi:MAG: 23S rRNA (guanosine(2251)-2'-O)-methyltransferase RlmB [Candidatus Latescibacterota bacterium]|nr:23S rRNA (guanosine(2251)-2'-O)-methyltransferase RlmB [Candidatus Latescibacterota bacterium]